MSGMGAREICGHSQTRTEVSGVGTMLRHILKSNQSLKEIRGNHFSKENLYNVGFGSRLRLVLLRLVVAGLIGEPNVVATEVCM